MKRKLRLLHSLPETVEYYGWKVYEVVGSESVHVTKYEKEDKKFRIITLCDDWRAYPDIDWALEASKFPAGERSGLTRSEHSGRLELPRSSVRVKGTWGRSNSSRLATCIRENGRGDKSETGRKPPRRISRHEGDRSSKEEISEEGRGIDQVRSGKKGPRLLRRTR